MKEEYEQYAGDADKLKALFQKGLDELGITDKPEDITITLLSQGSATENQSRESTCSSPFPRIWA